jgi:hypothetical protein
MQRLNRIPSASAQANSTASTNETRSFAGSANEVQSVRSISADAIRLYAFRKWEIAGKPAGDGVPFWLEAEKELAAENEDTSGRGNSQDADRHSGIRHPHSLKFN